jgi:hypothetical protein
LKLWACTAGVLFEKSSTSLSMRTENLAKRSENAAEEKEELCKYSYFKTLYR